MIIVEKSDPFSSESHRLIEMLSAELAAITGDNGKPCSSHDKGSQPVWSTLNMVVVHPAFIAIVYCA